MRGQIEQRKREVDAGLTAARRRAEDAADAVLWLELRQPMLALVAEQRELQRQFVNVGTFIVSRLIENYRRYLDRKSLAAALLAEVELLLKAVAEERGIYDRMEKWDDTSVPADRELPMMSETYKGALNYRVSIFEKCAQQIGQLDAETAKGLVRFFYFVDGLRDDVRPILYNPNTPPSVRRRILRWMLRRNLREGIREGLGFVTGLKPRSPGTGGLLGRDRPFAGRRFVSAGVRGPQRS